MSRELRALNERWVSAGTRRTLARELRQEGLTFSEIAERLDVSPETARQDCGGEKKPRPVSARWKLLGFTWDDYDRLLAEQEGHCALCPNKPKTRALHVDHDHKTGRVRGVLCHKCNYRLLGRGLESADLHDAAAGYLRMEFDARKDL